MSIEEPFIPRTVDARGTPINGLPTVKLQVNAAGRGSLIVDGHELAKVSGVEVRVNGGRETRVILQMIANVEIEISPDEVRFSAHDPSA